MTKLGVVVAVAVLFGCGGAVVEPEDAALREGDSALARGSPKTPTPDGKQLGTLGSNLRRRQTPNGFAYHGGPLMFGTTNVYFIWYGSWSGSSAQPVLVDFAQNLGGSAYFDAVTTYTNGAGVPASNGVLYSGAISDEYSMGATLSDSDVALVVSQTVAGGLLPADPDAVYVLLLSPDVDVTSGLCSSWCAEHNTTNANGTTVKYAVIGNPDRCPSQCSPQAVGPNAAGPADAMASLLGAELLNSITDPLFTAWYDRTGLEGADKCAWSYGATYTAANGALANVALGGRDWLLQELWSNAGKGGCVLSP